MSRRELLAAAGIGAGALALAPLARAKLPAGLSGGLEPELLTVTQRGFAAWWPTDSLADSTLRIARADGSGLRQLTLESGQVVHRVAIDDLEPGTEYRYELRSGDTALPTSPANPGSFTTLPELEGRRLARIAVLNDMHVGEHCSGTITNVNGSSVPPCFTGNDYAYRMTAAAVAEIAQLEPDLLVANGDLSDRGRVEDVRRNLALLRGIGVPLLVTRGNHDRLFHDPSSPPDGDVLRAEAFPDRAPADHALTSVVRLGDRLAVVGLDSCDPETGDGRLDLGGQLPWLDRTLTTLRGEGRRVLVFFHHHVAVAANATHPPPMFFGVQPEHGELDLLALIGRHEHVPLVMHGHTHRNYLTTDPLAPHAWFLENGAIKEYPSGYAMLDIHEDGMVRTFHRPVTDFTREWTRVSAQQVWGQQPGYTRGTLASRSFVLRFDGAQVLDPGGPAPSVFGPVGVPA